MIGNILKRTFATKQPVQIQTLQTYFTNSKILDFRSFPHSNNKIVLFCSHASNTLPLGYSWSENDKKNFSEKHWAWDLGALDASIYLASGLKCTLVHTLYSRLLIDPNRNIAAEDLINKEGDNIEIELNKDLTKEEKSYRIFNYHKPYYDAIHEISEKIDPDIVIGIHSFTPNREGEVRKLEVGVEYTNSYDLAKFLCDGMLEKKYDTQLNEPYRGDLGNALQQALLEKSEKTRHGAVFEFRNDILLDRSRAPRLKQDAYEVIQNACDNVQKNFKL